MENKHLSIYLSNMYAYFWVFFHSGACDNMEMLIRQCFRLSGQFRQLCSIGTSTWKSQRTTWTCTKIKLVKMKWNQLLPVIHTHMLPTSVMVLQHSQLYCNDNSMLNISKHLPLRLEECQTSSEIFDKMAGRIKDCVGPNYLPQVWDHIMKTHYKNMLTFSWLQENYHIAFIQIMLMERLDELMNPIWEHPTSQELLILTREMCPTLDAGSLVRVLLSLLYLNFDKYDSLCNHLYILCRGKVSEMNIHDLALLSYIARSMPSNISAISWTVPKLKEIIEDPDKEWTPKDVNDLSVIMTNTRHIMSYETTRFVNIQVILNEDIYYLHNNKIR